MGHSTALDIANTELTIEQQLDWHLRGNHYPPVPSSMIPVCIDAIDAYWEDNLEKEIDLPEGVTYRGKTTAPAREIIINHHLDAWCIDAEEDFEE